MKSLHSVWCTPLNRTRKAQLLMVVALGMMVLLSVGFNNKVCVEKPGIGPVAVLNTNQLQRQKSINISHLVERNEQRVRWIDGVCERHPELMTSRAIGEIWVSPRYSLAFCVVPKVGCTYWKRLLRYLEMDVPYDVTYPTDIDRYTVHYETLNYVTKYFVDSPGHVDKISPGLNFMFARDPYARVWSAYLDKFYLPDFWYIGRYVAVEIRETVSEMARTCGNDVTFEELIRYIYNHRSDIKLNEHFNTVNFICNPCKLKPDIVGKVETFTSDSDLVLANTGLLGEVPEDPNSERVSEEIKMLIEYNLDIADMVHVSKEIPDTCLDNLLISKRLWKVFQLNGYLGEDIRFPEERFKDVQSRNDYKNSLKEEILKYRHLASKDTLQQWKNQRSKSMQAAFNSLPQKVLEHFQEVYSIDFELFQYEKQPSWLVGK